MPAGRQGEVELLDQQVVAVALAQPLGLDHQVAEAGAGGDVDLVRIAPLVVLAVLGEQLLVGGQAGLALGLAGARAHPHPLELALQGALARRLGLLLEGQPLLLLLQPGGVVPLPGDALAAVELEDPAGHVVEEVAVVGDGDDGAGIVGEEVLQPGDGLGVEVVGGLVEQQQVGALEEQAAEGHPAALAARELVDVGVRRRQPQGVHGDLQRAVELPGVGGLDGVLHAPLLGHQLVHLVVGHRVAELGVDLVEPGEQGAGLRHPLLDVAEHVLGGVEPRLLGEVADLGPLGGPGLADELLDLAGHDLQQRALAGAVEAQDADLGAGKERQPDILQHLAVGRIDLPQVLHHVDVLLSHGDSLKLRILDWGIKRQTADGGIVTQRSARQREAGARSPFFTRVRRLRPRVGAERPRLGRSAPGEGRLALRDGRFALRLGRSRPREFS